MYRALVLLVTISSSLCWTLRPHTKNEFLYKDVHSDADPGQPLLLTPLIEANKLEDARKLSQVVHKDFAGAESHSGFITVNKNFNSSLFFWYFPAKEDFDKAPLVIWLQGGPGAPAVYGMFCENGPFEVVTKNTVSARKHSWHRQQSLLYIDAPAGSGFSFTNTEGYAKNQTQIGNDLYEFLQQFYTLFPNLQSKDLFVSGEQYGSKYAVALGKTVLEKNPTSKVKINLSGLVIAGGFVDPIHQHGYSDYGYQIGLIDVNAKKQIKAEEQKLITYIKAKQWAEASAQQDTVFATFIDKSKIANIYSYLYNKDPSPTLFGYPTAYLQQNDVRAALHVGNLPLDSSGVYENLEVDFAQSVAPWLSEVLSNYRVLVYNGQTDLLSPYPLTEKYLQHLKFNGADTYKVAERKLWKVGEDLAGYVKEAGNLTEVMIRNAGHLVTIDQPSWAYDLIYKFTRKLSLY